MSVLLAPTVSVDGLLLYYDMNNIRSYKGPPLTNKLPNLTASSASGGTYVLAASSEIVDIPTVGSTNVTVCNLQNTGASWCCVNFMSFGNGGNIFTGSTLYTYLLLYRVDSGYTHPNFMYRYEYAHYSRALSASEVQQNFNAHRGRYGL